MATTTYGTPYVQSSDLVSSYPGTSSTLASRIDDISLKVNGLNDQTGMSYSLVLTDGGKTVTLSNAAAVSVTIPANSSVAFPTGTIIRFVNKGAGTVTISPTGGVTLNGGNLTLAQYAAVQIVKLATDTWGVVESTGTIAGLVPITPTSIANSGGSASLAGISVSFSGVTSVSLNGVFTTACDVYRVLFQGTGSAGLTVNLRMRASGADASGATDYQYQTLVTGGGGTNSANAWGNAVVLNTNRASADMLISNPALATTTAFVGTTTRTDYVSVSGGQHNQAAAYDGFTLFVSPGSFSGTVRVYGYKN